MNNLDHVHVGAEGTDGVIETLGEALADKDRPLVISSGKGLARSKTGGPTVETDDHVGSAQAHDTRHQGRIAQHVLVAREKAGWLIPRAFITDRREPNRAFRLR